MDYSKHYTTLIERAKTRSLSEVYYEQHHIVPRCLGGSDNQSNLVSLTPEEHYVAHQLLTKMYPDEPNLIYAANMMCVNRTNNKLYGWVRRRMSLHMKTNNPMQKFPEKNPFAKKGSEHPAFNRVWSEEAKNKIRESKLGANNPIFNIKPWQHPRATSDSKNKWRNADKYYAWWINSGLEHGQNAMARAFGESYTITHANLVKYFRNGWIPNKDPEWIEFCKI